MAANAAIEHVVVLMLENRSFDHMLGYMRSVDPRINGLYGTEYNYVAPDEPNPVEVVVSNDAEYVPDLDPGPGHSVEDVHTQLFASSQDGKATNAGFVESYGQQKGVTPDQARKIMRCFAPSHLPVLTTLASQFAVCNRWHASLPGPTVPNRMFAHCATSGGFADDDYHDYNMTTIFERLSDLKLDSWRIYFHDPPNSLLLTNLRNLRYKQYFEQFSAFLRDCRGGTLPWYSFIEPRYFSALGSVANDQHPPNGVLAGEQLIADVYNALRASPQWSKSLLLIVWDEHGGFYDHVAPPTAIPPDEKTAPDFDFKLLGVRVPAVIVSPLIPAGTVDNTIYDHSSIPATLKTIFGTRAFLTQRDQLANTFDHICTLSSPRVDAPVNLAPAHQALVETLHATTQGLAAQVREPTDLQRSFVDLANHISPETARSQQDIKFEFEAAHHVYQAGLRFFLS